MFTPKRKEKCYKHKAKSLNLSISNSNNYFSLYIVHTLALTSPLYLIIRLIPISASKGDRRKYDKGPSRLPAKHVPGRVPELEKNVGRGVSRVEGSTLKETSLIKL